MKSVYMKRSICVAAATALVGGWGACFAEGGNKVTDETLIKGQGYDPAREYRSVVVSFEDLNLERTAGIRTLYQRIDVAAKQACLPRPSKRNFAMHDDWSSCYDQAMEDAVASSGVPALHQYHLAQSGAVGHSPQIVKAH